MSNLKFKPVKKDQLFYNAWQYVTHYHMSESHVLRDLDHKSVDLRLNWIAERNSMKKFRWTGNVLSELIPEPPRVTDEVRQNLHGLLDRLETLDQPHKLVVSTHTFSVYTNSVSVFAQLDHMPGVSVVHRSQAVIDRAPGTILLHDPTHTHRTFFSLVTVNHEQKQNLARFFENQTEIRPSPALSNWVHSRYLRLQDYYFIDHTGMSALTLLNLVAPGLTRKTVQILPR